MHIECIPLPKPEKTEPMAGAMGSVEEKIKI
jgi:hypothetical protein